MRFEKPAATRTASNRSIRTDTTFKWHKQCSLHRGESSLRSRLTFYSRADHAQVIGREKRDLRGEEAEPCRSEVLAYMLPTLLNQILLTSAEPRGRIDGITVINWRLSVRARVIVGPIPSIGLLSFNGVVLLLARPDQRHYTAPHCAHICLALGD